MLQGDLDPILAEKWAWDRSDEGAACGMYNPTRDLKAIKGYKEMDGDN
jgi:sarcosine oxidase / L-pipecolate oxidase